MLHRIWGLPVDAGRTCRTGGVDRLGGDQGSQIVEAIDQRIGVPVDQPPQHQPVQPGQGGAGDNADRDPPAAAGPFGAPAEELDRLGVHGAVLMVGDLPTVAVAGVAAAQGGGGDRR